MTVSRTVKRTVLAEEHERLGGKMVEFAGWWMPVQYEGLRQEHECVRTHVGLFDVSHMGEIIVKGPQALEALQWWTTNDVSKLEAGVAQYSLLPNDQGGLVDDLIVYCLVPGEEYLLCVNASNKDKDFEWIVKNNKFNVEVNDVSDDWSQVAVQGPQAIELLTQVFDEDIKNVPSFRFVERNYQGGTCLLARTGYTGEEGFEVFVPNAQAVELWRDLLAKGEELGAKPIGLGARDTLRTEMKYSLYGHEIDDHSNPYQAGLGWVVKPLAKDFIGKDKIVAVKEQGLKQKLVGLEMLDRGIPRQGYRLLDSADNEIGQLTSGTMSPSSGKNIGIAYVALPQSEIGSEVFVEIRSRKVKAKVVKTPFV